MWGQSDKYIKAWIHRIRNKMIQAPIFPPVLSLHHPPTLEAFNRPTKTNIPLKKFTQLNLLSLEIHSNVDM